MNDVFKPAVQSDTTTRPSLLKLNRLLWRTNHGQKNISYIVLIIWNNLPNSLKQQITLTLTNTELRSIFTEWKMRRTIYIATFYFYYYYIIITVIIDIIIYFTGGSRSSSSILTAMLLSLLLSVAVALIKYQYYLLYQPLFF